MTDYSELVERLRDIETDFPATCAMAADAIEAQRERIERLENVLSELADLVDDVRTGDYKPDSYTTQPARAALMEKP